MIDWMVGSASTTALTVVVAGLGGVGRRNSSELHGAQSLVLTNEVNTRRHRRKLKDARTVCRASP